jgi:TonB family protein
MSRVAPRGRRARALGRAWRALIASVLLAGCNATTGTSVTGTGSAANATAASSSSPAPVQLGECGGARQTELPDFHLQKVDHLPEVVARVPPEYPEQAFQSRIDGIVSVLVLICADGSLQQAKVSRSVPMLDQAALESVRQWTYQPATRGGTTVAAWLETQVEFRLPPRGEPTDVR